MLVTQVVRLTQDERGATAIEYGLIVSLVVIVMLTGLATLADGTSGMYADISAKVTNAAK